MRARASTTESKSDKERDSERERKKGKESERKRQTERERKREKKRQRERAEEMRVCCKQVGDIKVFEHPHFESREAGRGSCRSEGGATRGAMDLDFTFDEVPCSCVMRVCDESV